MSIIIFTLALLQESGVGLARDAREAVPEAEARRRRKEGKEGGKKKNKNGRRGHRRRKGSQRKTGSKWRKGSKKPESRQVIRGNGCEYIRSIHPYLQCVTLYLVWLR